MSTTSKILLAITLIAVVGLGIWIPKEVKVWKERDARFVQALKHRTPRAGEQGAVLKETVEDMKKAVPAPSPEAQRFAQTMNSGAPGGPTVMQIMVSAETVKTWPQPQREAARKTMEAVLRSNDPNERLMAVETLGRMGDSAAIPAIFPLQNDPDGKVSTAAKQTLRALGYNM